MESYYRANDSSCLLATMCGISAIANEPPDKTMEITPLITMIMYYMCDSANCSNK